MKIIGWDRKGNVVRFALGDDNLEYWSGDDWNDSPYEHNASTTPLFGTEEYVDVSFRYSVSVLEPADDWNYHGNSPFCMDDFKERKAPFLVIDPTGEEQYYSKCVNKKDVFGIFMGDRFEDIDWDALHGTVIYQ